MTTAQLLATVANATSSLGSIARANAVGGCSVAEEGRVAEKGGVVTVTREAFLDLFQKAIDDARSNAKDLLGDPTLLPA